MTRTELNRIGQRERGYGIKLVDTGIRWKWFIRLKDNKPVGQPELAMVNLRDKKEVKL